MRFVYTNADPDVKQLGIETFGGKALNLLKMAAFDQVEVPPFFVVSAELYRTLVNRVDGLRKMIASLANGDLAKIEKTSAQIRAMIVRLELPAEVGAEITSAYRRLDGVRAAVAVRSSATAEDLAEASFAGQQDTYLNVCGETNVLTAVKKCLASLFTTRAVVYRQSNRVDSAKAALSVVVQQMIDPVVSGVAFSLDPATGFSGAVRIDAAYGLGEAIVQGLVSPDTFLVTKKGLLLMKEMGAKEKMVVYAAGGTKVASVAREQVYSWSLGDAAVVKVAEMVMGVEKFYGHFVDIEYAVDKAGKIWLLQARPETKWQPGFQKNPHLIPLKQTRLDQEATTSPVLTGLGASGGAAVGTAVFLGDGDPLAKVKPGNILLAKRTDPDMVPAMQVAGAVVTAVGGRTSHAAIVSRELGLPAVVGTEDLSRLKSLEGKTVTVDGDLGMVYAESLKLKSQARDIDTAKLPRTRTRVGLILADVTQAFRLSRLAENDFEVGLLRAEFILGRIGIHPQALDEFDSGSLKVKSPAVYRQVKTRLVKQGFTHGKDYFVDGLARGMAAFAQAFAGRSVIYRTTDFKTNEYKMQLVGGSLYEPDEDNPMLGNRGTGRYLMGGNLKYLGWELEALDEARTKYQGANLELMLPFVRTLFEAKTAIAFINKRVKSKNLKIIAMSEIPSNALIPQEFIKLFDGFSLGSNDMTQLVLGTDRDNQKLQATYDEHDPAVVKAILATVFAGLKHHKKVGFCGQGVSDSLIIAGLVAIAGITSASVVPDRYLQTKLQLFDLEKQRVRLKDLGKWLTAQFGKRYKQTKHPKDALYAGLDWAAVVESALSLGGINSFAQAQKLIDERE